MENRFMLVEEVAAELGVSASYAYKVIRELNNELKAKGFVTIAGRINRQYFNDRVYGLGKEGDNGLMQQLEGFIREHSDTKLIIIDTLQKVRGDDGDKYSYANDYQIISNLKALTDANQIAVLIVHHTRKQDAEDKFDTISGTTGLLGSADGAFLLRKEKRTGPEATLDVIGRDQQDQRFKLLFKQENCTWDLTEIETQLWRDPPDPTLDAIAALVNAESPIWEGTATELAQRIGSGMLPYHLSRKLNVNVARLLAEHGVLYAPSRSHDGRRVRLYFAEGKGSR